MKILLTVHVIAAIFLIGPLVGSSMTGLRALRTGDAAAARSTARTVRIYALASLLVAVLGLAMVRGRGHGWGFAFSDGWIISSIILYVVALATTLGLVAPAFGAVGSATAADLRPVRARAGAGAGITALLFVTIAVLMVYRP